MSETAMTGEEIAAMARTYDPRLADVILGMEVLHQAVPTAPRRSLQEVTRHVTDSYLPIRYRNKPYAAAVIKATNPDISPQDLEFQLAVQMAVARRYRKDPGTLTLTERVLHRRGPGVVACLARLVTMRRDSITPPYGRKFDLAVLSQENLAEALGELTNTQLMVAENESFFHTDPPSTSVLTANRARDLAIEAGSIAYSAERSQPMILERIKQGDQ